MDVVIRPVNDRFLRDVVFPAFEVGVADAHPALERLCEEIHDDRTLMLVETLLEKGVEGSFFTLDAETWLEAAYRLLFWEWIPSVRGGWQLSAEYVGFAGGFDETLHLALMLEDARYPYWSAAEAQRARIAFFGQPETSKPLSALICGRWDPFPRFAPDQALATRGRDPIFKPMDEIAAADWTWRSTELVSALAVSLAGKLANLIRRETDRLRPIAVPEADEIFEYWTGRTTEPPLLTVAFSGLGRGSPNWVRDLGALTRVLRGAAELEQGLTSIIAPRGHHGDTD